MKKLLDGFLDNVQYFKIIALLLKFLDAKEIRRSERIQALQNYAEVKNLIKEQEQAYLLKRSREKEEAGQQAQEKREKKKKLKERTSGFDGRWYAGIDAPSFMCMLEHGKLPSTLSGPQHHE